MVNVRYAMGLIGLLGLLSTCLLVKQNIRLSNFQQSWTLMEDITSSIAFPRENDQSMASFDLRNSTVLGTDEVATSSSSRILDDIILQNQNATRNSSCRILISNWWPDHHYEILESIALRFPLPWTKLKHNCPKAGLDPNDPIEIDFLLSFARYVAMGTKMEQMEGWGWKSYFEEYLQGRTRNRTNVDGRYIKFGAIVGSTMEDKDALDLGQYGAEIEASCVKVKKNPQVLEMSFKWLSEDPVSHYCVLHEKQPFMPRSLLPQTCQLNPMHSGNCWFLPIDYPKFPPRKSPKNNSLSICIPTRKQKDPYPLIQALKELQPSNLKVQLQGRRSDSKLKPFAAANLSHYLLIRDDLQDYWRFQQSITECHVLLPLVERFGPSKIYFQGRGLMYKGKLSGFVSQMIGNRIPGLMHTELANIYRPYFTAPVYEYNQTTNFTEAFRQMIESLRGPTY